MKLLFLDIETTGFKKTFHQILEIAAILYDTEKDEPIDKFHEYIKPKELIENDFIHGITNEMVLNCRIESDVLRDFVEFVHLSKPDYLVGHNIDNFDEPFIKARTEIYRLPWPTIDTIDTLLIARKEKLPTAFMTETGKPSYKQESIAMAMGITYQAHSAIEDVKALIKIYGRIEEEMKKQKRKEAGF
jgi:DNA polymerase III epsilon subunit-like protein